MAVPLILAIDRQNCRLVSNAIVPGSVASLPSLFQGNSRDLQITVLDPTGDLGGTPFSKVDCGSNSLRVSIGDTPTGTSGGPTPIALQTVFTWDATLLQFTGSLALNTAAIDAFIGTAASKRAYFEVNIIDAGNRITILQVTFTIFAVVDEATSTAPTPTDSYYTADESDSRYVKHVFAAGETILMVSADGTKQGLIYWGDDNSFHADPIT
jgi:hypothetical protein